MIFYVYFDPDIISEAEKKGNLARQALIAILQGFLQNCLIAEFEDYRNQTSIKNQFDNLENTFDRKRVKGLLASLKKRNRFIYCLMPDYRCVKSDLQCLLDQAVEKELDHILLTEDQENYVLNGIEISNLETYQNSEFEIQRSKIAYEGRTFRNEELGEYDFLNQVFKKAFQYASKIEICDNLYGKQFGDNFEYTSKVFLKWLGEILINPNECSLIFHCGNPQKATQQYITGQLKSSRPNSLSSMFIQLQFYHDNLPHDRFIITNQVAFEIGRGMDFLDRYTHKKRDLTVGYKDMTEVMNLVNSYSSSKSDLINKTIQAYEKIDRREFARLAPIEIIVDL